MDFKTIEELKKQSKWRDLLRNLPVGENTLSFPSVEKIKSCKAIAYDFNSDKNGRRYTFKVDKDSLTVIINVEETEQCNH